jgi:hypothetical protein
MAKVTRERNMTQHTAERTPRPQSPVAQADTPAFKPVALPALAAAVHAVRAQSRLPKSQDLPAILRKEAQIG